jgi:hypothetical protein
MMIAVQLALGDIMRFSVRDGFKKQAVLKASEKDNAPPVPQEEAHISAAKNSAEQIPTRRPIKEEWLASTVWRCPTCSVSFPSSAVYENHTCKDIIPVDSVR